MQSSRLNSSMNGNHRRHQLSPDILSFQVQLRFPEEGSTRFRYQHKRRNSIHGWKCLHKNGVRKFFDDTTINGFLELYYAKSWFWRLIWFIAVASMIALTVYQLQETIKAVMDEPSTTNIETLNDIIEYPPIEICYLHWVLWVNWTLAVNRGFDKQTVLYGLSFLNDVVNEIPFNLNETKFTFERVLKENGFKKIIQFYSAISDPTPPGISTSDLGWYVWHKIIDPGFSRLCYVATNEMIQDGLMRISQMETDFKNSILLTYDPNYFVLNKNYVSLIEYEVLVKGHASILLQRNFPDNLPANISDFKVPPVINVDGVRVNLIMPSQQSFQSQIKLTGHKYIWLYHDNKPCLADKQTVLTEYCDKVCVWQYMREKLGKTCLNVEEAFIMDMENVDNLCVHNTTFLSTGTAIVGDYVFKLPTMSTESFNSCLTRFCTNPCEQWTFSSTISTLPIPYEFTFLNFPNNLYIQYPEASAILVFREVSLQSWENMVGNMGGIMGLWLGASVMSILQIIYLICFNDCDERIGERRSSKREQSRNQQQQWAINHQLRNGQTIHGFS